MGALDVHRALLARDVVHEVVRLRRPVQSADDLPDALGLPPERCVVTRCYVADGAVVAVLVHPGEVPDPVALLDALAARSVRAASAAEVNAATDCAAGLVSPVGLPAAVRVLADSVLADSPQGDSDVVYTAAAEGGVALGIRVADLLAVTGALLAPLSSHPRRPAERWDGVLDLDDGAEQARGSGPAHVVDLDARSREHQGPA